MHATFYICTLDLLIKISPVCIYIISLQLEIHQQVKWLQRYYMHLDFYFSHLQITIRLVIMRQEHTTTD